MATKTEKEKDAEAKSKAAEAKATEAREAREAVAEVKDAETTHGDVETRDGKQFEISDTDANHSFYDPSMPFISEPKDERQLTDKESRLARQKEGLQLGAQGTPALANKGTDVDEWGARETLDNAVKMDQVGRQLTSDEIDGEVRDKNVLADYTIIQEKEQAEGEINVPNDAGSGEIFTQVNSDNLSKDAFDENGNLKAGYRIVDAKGNRVNWNSRMRVNWRRDGTGILYPETDYGDNVKRTVHD